MTFVIIEALEDNSMYPIEPETYRIKYFGFWRMRLIKIVYKRMAYNIYD